MSGKVFIPVLNTLLSGSSSYVNVFTPIDVKNFLIFACDVLLPPEPPEPK